MLVRIVSGASIYHGYPGTWSNVAPAIYLLELYVSGRKSCSEKATSYKPGAYFQGLGTSSSASASIEHVPHSYQGGRVHVLPLARPQSSTVAIIRYWSKILFWLAPWRYEINGECLMYLYKKV